MRENPKYNKKRVLVAVILLLVIIIVSLYKNNQKILAECDKHILFITSNAITQESYYKYTPYTGTVLGGKDFKNKQEAITYCKNNLNKDRL